MIQKTLLVAGVLGLAAMSMAQQTGFYSDGRPERIFNPVSGLDRRDITFLKNAEAANEFEIESSQIALQNGSSDFVKNFAKDMVTDHTAAKAEVEDVASHKGVTLSTMLPMALERQLNHLRGLHGEAFDNAYRSAQKGGHEQAIKLFKSEVENGHDQDVKAVAVKLLPTIELHMKNMMNGKTETGSTAADHGN